MFYLILHLSRSRNPHGRLGISGCTDSDFCVSRVDTRPSNAVEDKAIGVSKRKTLLMIRNALVGSVRTRMEISDG